MRWARWEPPSGCPIGGKRARRAAHAALARRRGHRMTAKMKRRDIITLLSGAAAVWPLAARAQQATGGFFRSNAPERGAPAGREGRALSNYAAPFLDETGELTLLEPCLPDELGASRGTTSLNRNTHAA